MKIEQEPRIENSIVIEKQIKEAVSLIKEGKKSKNNRKNTNSRLHQVVTYLDNSCWPPKVKQKVIKHLN
jgi:hypothetical protein